MDPQNPQTLLAIVSQISKIFLEVGLSWKPQHKQGSCEVTWEMEVGMSIGRMSRWQLADCLIKCSGICCHLLILCWLFMCWFLLWYYQQSCVNFFYGYVSPTNNLLNSRPIIFWTQKAFLSFGVQNRKLTNSQPMNMTHEETLVSLRTLSKDSLADPSLSNIVLAFLG